MIQEFQNELHDRDDEDDEDLNTTGKHHRDSLSFQKCFFEDTKPYRNYTCNAFELGELTRIDDTSVKFDRRIIVDTKFLELNGEQKFHIFWNDRLIYSKAPVSDTIKKNCLIGNAAKDPMLLPKDPTLTQALVTKLRAACAARQKHAEKIFQ